MAAPILQFKRGAFTNLPGLRAGEPGFTTDRYDLYVGLTSSTTTNKFFGSARYWTRETASTAAGLNFVENSTGTDYITLKAPDSVSGIGTYTLPDTNTIVDGYFLKVSTGGQLSWQNITSNPVFTNTTFSGITTISGSLNNTASTTNSGITTFTNTTDNTLGNSNTGAVQIDGGVGIDKNLTVGANLYVGGYAEFVGVATFRGGTINLGDGNTDNINVGGEFISGLAPNVDNTYDIGISTQKWRDAYFAGIGSFATGAYIDAVQIGITTPGEIDTTTGNLTLDSASGQTIIDDNLSVTGIATVTGAFVANGNVTLGDAAGDTITINGTTTFNQPLVGTIGTATRALTVDTTTAPSGTFYPGLFVNSTGTASTAVYVDAGISYVSNTDTLTLTGDLAVNGGDVTTSATTFNLVNATATNINFGGAATALVMGAATGIATISNATLTLPNATTVNVNGANPTLASSSTGTLTLFNTNITSVNEYGAATSIQIGAATGITTVRNNLTVAGDVRINGNDIQASDGNANITLTSNTLTAFAGDIRVNGNDIQASDGNANITMTSNTLTAFAGDIRVNGNDIQSSTGANVITLNTNNATFANDVTVTGNLYVNGSTTQVNTAALTVEDRTIDLGIVNGAAPSTNTTWDLGILFNYYSAAAAKKSAVIWEHADARFKFASVIGADTDGTDVNTPQLTVSTFAPIEVAELWVNNTCTGGSQQVVGCIGAELNLQNIVVDAGQF